MKKTFAMLLFSVVLIGQVSAQFSPAYTARLQFVLDSVCNKYHIKGTSAAVLVPGIGTWKGVNGISHNGQSITPDMLFGIGSNTKTFVAAAMLKLQEQGKVNLDDTIGAWITGNSNINGQITVRQLLNHTSGIADYTQNIGFGDSIMGNLHRVWQPEDLLQLVDAPDFAAGTSWAYSNTNYLLAGLIIRQVLSQPVNTTLRDYIFTPQGLQHSIFFPADTASAAIAYPWSVFFNNAGYLEDLTAQYGYSNNAMFSAAYTAGAIMQTAEDNVLFWHRLISGNIINNASLNQMLNVVHIGNSAPGTGHGIGYGLGIFKYQNFINGHTIYTHGGTNIGYINENLADSVTGVCISVLTNQDSISNDDLMLKLINALHKVTLTVFPTAIAEVYNNAAFHIYPNPVSDYINISMDEMRQPVQFSLYDMNGKCVVNRELDNGKATISILELTAGVYIGYLMQNGTVIATQKIQVAK